MTNYLIIIVVVMQITIFVTALICYRKTKIRNETDFDTLQNLISKNQLATASNLDSLKELVTNNFNTLKKSISENQLAMVSNLDSSKELVTNNFNTLKKSISENQLVMVSNLNTLKELVTSSQTIIINKLNMIDKNSENILKELKEPLSLD